MKSAHKRALSLAALCAGGVLMASTAVNAQGAFPNKPVRLVVLFPPGGGTSYVAQLVGEGVPTHLAVRLLKLTADIKTQPVPYKGTGP